MTIISIARAGRAHHGGSRRRDAQPITPAEARLLSLRPTADAVAALPPRPAGTPVRSSPRAPRTFRAPVDATFWLVVLATFAIGAYVIDRGGHAAPFPPDAAALSASGSGRLPVAVEPGDVTVRVTVRSSTIPWFWCLESSRGLPADQHLCRNSGETAPADEPVATEGVVHLDAATVESAAFFVQMYCRDACDWRADAERDLP